jgi:hypothetical protein
MKPRRCVVPRGRRRLAVGVVGLKHLIHHFKKDQRLPGRHITDCQTRLYMKSRQSTPRLVKRTRTPAQPMKRWREAVSAAK